VVYWEPVNWSVGLRILSGLNQPGGVPFLF
jgi:hypothetical protein